jgi:alkanesulfonate monooxygenase SsuD/methylene tetrahydromethanopterin reductase-like flavin-dependent oxidoreductase (luciferase family)
LALAKSAAQCVCTSMRRTPIEIAIDGAQAKLNRHQRWIARERAKGLNRVIVTVPAECADQVKAFAAELRRKAGFE